MFSYKYLRPAVLRPDAAHIVTALLFGMHIGHPAKLSPAAVTWFPRPGMLTIISLRTRLSH